jgi:hypothetical protein
MCRSTPFLANALDNIDWGRPEKMPDLGALYPRGP